MTYGVMADGSPVLLLAEHGRNLRGDPRASVAVAEPAAWGEPLDADA